MSALRREALKKSMPPLPEQHRQTNHANPSRRFKKDYTPLSWDSYFEERKLVSVGEDRFQVYCSGSDGPALVLLHGGGHSALTWALFTKHITSICSCRVLAMDLRGHGNTQTTNETDLHATVLARDVACVIASFFGDDDVPEVVLLGHSMGGAVAVHAASMGLIASLSLLVVIDVVEGTALDALSQMVSFLRGRPKEFKSLEQAIEWSLRSGQVRNLESARVSMPGQLVRIPDELHCGTSTVSEVTSPYSSAESRDLLPPPSQTESRSNYTWRIDLTKTEKYWQEWFSGMSELFLSCSVPKILLLAGVDRLDKTLTIGQMQGKFQMQVLANCGHTVQEDSPEKVAGIVASFMFRHRLANPKESFTGTMPAC